MGLFNLFNKENSKTNTQNDTQEMLNRLSGVAGNVINMLKQVLITNQGGDMNAVLLYASGLAGFAAKETVKHTGQQRVQIGTASGKKYYFGDAINKYVLESRTATFSFCNAVTGISQSEVEEIISRVASTVGSEEFAIWGMNPNDIYVKIKECWFGIFNNMTSVYCKSPEEWPVLFNIVTQNVILQAGAESVRQKKELGLKAMECAIVISKMEDDSL